MFAIKKTGFNRFCGEITGYSGVLQYAPTTGHTADVDTYRPNFKRKGGKKTTLLCCKRTHFEKACKPLTYESVMN